MRKEQEDLVLAAHASGCIQTAILRLPDFYGPGVDKSFLWSVFQAAKTGKRAQIVGPIDIPPEFVYLPDAGIAMLRIAGLFNPLMRELVEMHYLQTSPVILDDTKIENIAWSTTKNAL